MDKRTLFAALRSDLVRFDRVILIYDRQGTGLCFDFCDSRAVKISQYKILVLSIEEGSSKENLMYRQITEADRDRLYRLYHMYEFSDRFRVLSRERSHGCLFDLLDTKVLNMEEIFEALLY